MGPSARHGLAMAYDSSRARVALFGGASASVLLADTWTWDGTEWTQVADTGPDARTGHGIAFDAVRQHVVLFGGRTNSGLVRDTWAWNGAEWTQLQDVGPRARVGHVMAFDASAGRVVLFGGAADGGAGLNDTWAWNGSAWTEVADTGPEPRVDAAVVGGAALVLFGGVNSIDPALSAADRRIFGDSWRWEGSAWTMVQDIGPLPRWGHGMALRSEAGRITLFGGAGVFATAEDPALVSGLRRDTWEVQETTPSGGGGTSPVGVDVAEVTISPDAVASTGEVMDVAVTLTGPAPSVVSLVAAIFVDEGGSYSPVDPPGFTIPDPITVLPGDTFTQFQIVRDAQPLAPGNYAIGVGVMGGAMAGAFFSVL
jgi:hypothetical protein